VSTVLCLLTGAVCLLYIVGVHKQRFNCSNTPGPSCSKVGQRYPTLEQLGSVWYGDITCWSMLGLKDLQFKHLEITDNPF